MFYYLYQITNLVNNKIYVGVHKTHNMNDGYMGSGKVIVRAIEKHGIDNFKKDILEIFDDSESMYAREKEFVNEEFLTRKDVYNLRRGGLGGFDYINSHPEKYLTIKRLSGLMTQKEMLQRWKDKYISDVEFREKIKQNGKLGNLKAQINNPNGTFFEKSHSEETKKIIGNKNSITQSGKGNSQFGSMWITNGVESKKIKKDYTIQEGWYKGRKLKRV